jgi:hypothetical protein
MMAVYNLKGALMKKLLLEMDVPKWAKWKATDVNGRVWVYSHRPEYSNGFWVMKNFNGISYLKCILTLPYGEINSEDTLVEIK